MARNPQNHEHDVDPASTEDVTTTDGPEAPAPGTVGAHADEGGTPLEDIALEKDLRHHAEVLSCLVADTYRSGLLVLQARDADPQTGQERDSAMHVEDSDIVSGVKHVRIRSRKIPNQIANAAEDMAEHGPHHLYASLAIMADQLPAGRRGLKTDIVGVLGLVAYFEDGTDYSERLPLEPDYVLGCGDGIQAFYLFDDPALVPQAEPVAIALQAHAECHPATADLAHGWWVPGRVRYSPKGDEPIRVIKPWDGTSRTRLADLEKALGLATETPRREAEGWPTPLRFAAYHGLAGKFVEKLLPRSEADPAALLVHTVVAFGNAVGRGPHMNVGATRHGANLYAAFIGETGTGRKGTAAAEVRALFSLADPDWTRRSRGREALVLAGVRTVSHVSCQARPGSILSEVLREGWDGHNLKKLTKDPVQATDPHISIVGDITIDEFRSFLRRAEFTNGFANRLLFVLTARSKLLSRGGGLTKAELEELSSRLREALEAAREIGVVERDPEADKLWDRMYNELAAPRPLERARLGRDCARCSPAIEKNFGWCWSLRACSNRRFESILSASRPSGTFFLLRFAAAGTLQNAGLSAHISEPGAGAAKLTSGHFPSL